MRKTKEANLHDVFTLPATAQLVFDPLQDAGCEVTNVICERKTETVGFICHSESAVLKS
jgi:hypothetical protein